jgi:hypothetical protein
MNNATEYVGPTQEQKDRLLSWTTRSTFGTPWNGPKHSYEGTVTLEEKDRRRAANKVARASRRGNRK